MTPIHLRLTAWYAGAVVIALAAGAIVVAQVQTRFARHRLDAEMNRLQLTVAAVLHNEFGEGLDLPGAASEASMEVVAPDRTILISDPSGETLAQWGIALPAAWRASPAAAVRPVTGNIAVGDVGFRLFQSRVTDGARVYDVAVLAPLAVLESERSELLEALGVGVFVALAVAMLGGWVVGRRALKPLSDMALQAVSITERDPSGRLRPPNRNDELGRLASAFNELLDRLSTALVAQRQFMADASHQLRTPVSIVRTTAQVILRQQNRPGPEYHESMSIVAEQAARLARLVDGMFLLSRADAGGQPLHKEALYVDELVSECGRGLSVIASEHGVRLKVDGATDVQLTGDEDLLRQMLVNLLENAVRHTARGGTVSTAVAVAPGMVTIDVADQGPGIAPQDRERIFERFVRIQPGSDGAGLGLAIARWIAEAHGGSLLLESSSPSGSCFRVTLPSDQRTHCITPSSSDMAITAASVPRSLNST
jgi:signal transduction histidine kinase